MDPVVGAALISSVGSLFGGALGERGANARSDASLAFAREQMAAQKEFAQQGIRWRVEDAKAAGVHPLYAMGAQVTPYQSVNFQPESPSYGMPQAMADMGQNIGRAVQAKMTAAERFEDDVTRALRIKNMQLNNDLIESQIARNYGVSLPPPMPGISVSPLAPPEAVGAAIGASSRTEVKPVELNATSAVSRSREAGEVSDYQFARQPDGGLVVVPSKDFKDRGEDQLVPEMLWAWRNQLMPWLGIGDTHQAPSVADFPLPAGFYWKYDRLRGAYYPHRNEGRR